MPTSPLKFAFALPLAALPLALAACGPKAEKSEQAAAEPTAPSSEWVEQNPTEAAVPVTVPDTPMTNVPNPSASAQP